MTPLLLSLLRRFRRERYGAHDCQRLEVRGKEGPAVVVLHGGSWAARYGKWTTSFIAADLARRGFVSINAEYRRVGLDGGYPATLQDAVAVACWACERHDDVTLLGHSAGGQLALYAASKVPVRRVVAMAAPCDLVRGHGPAVHAFLGGTPSQVPERYAEASPVALAPIGVPTLLVHGVNDATVSVEHSRRYAAAAGQEAELIELPDAVHRSFVDPRTAAWQAAASWL
jgi:acetyl esterase/lipase